MYTKERMMMKIFEYNEAKQVVVCGDIHGAFETMVFKTCVQYGMTDTLIIVAGDCGFGFERPNHYINLYNGLAGRLKKANNWIVFVRGNHDDPQLLVDCDMERITMDRIYQTLKENGHPVDKWYYGHFHQKWTWKYENTDFKMLDIMEFATVRIADAELE